MKKLKDGSVLEDGIAFQSPLAPKGTTQRLRCKWPCECVVYVNVLNSMTRRLCPLHAAAEELLAFVTKIADKAPLLERWHEEIETKGRTLVAKAMTPARNDGGA